MRDASIADREGDRELKKGRGEEEKRENHKEEKPISMWTQVIKRRQTFAQVKLGREGGAVLSITSIRQVVRKGALIEKRKEGNARGRRCLKTPHFFLGLL